MFSPELSVADFYHTTYLATSSNSDRAKALTFALKASTSPKEGAVHPLISVNSDGSIDWKTKLLDMSVIEAVSTYFLDPKFSDDQIKKQLYAIEEMLLASPLFRALNSPNIRVTPEHQGNTLFHHSLDVLVDAVTDGLEPKYILAIRFMALFHDIAKVFGAAGMASMYHALVSTLMLETVVKKFFSRWGNDFAHKILFCIQYHHTFQELAFADAWKLSKSVIVRRFARDAETAMLLYLLSKSDMNSVASYRQFIPNNQCVFGRVQPEVTAILRSRCLF